MALASAINEWEEQSRLTAGMAPQQPGDQDIVISSVPETIREENSRQIAMQLQEIEFKQVQLAKLQCLKESIENRKFLEHEESRVKGKYQQAISSLVELLDNTKGDIKEIQQTLDLTIKDTLSTDRSIKLQGAQAQQTEHQIQAMEKAIKTKEYESKMNAKLNGQMETFQSLKSDL